MPWNHGRTRSVGARLDACLDAQDWQLHLARWPIECYATLSSAWQIRDAIFCGRHAPITAALIEAGPTTTGFCGKYAWF